MRKEQKQKFMFKNPQTGEIFLMEPLDLFYAAALLGNWDKQLATRLGKGLPPQSVGKVLSEKNRHSGNSEPED